MGGGESSRHFDFAAVFSTGTRSLVRWLTFWAIGEILRVTSRLYVHAIDCILLNLLGWQAMCTQYRRKIYGILHKMQEVRQNLRSANVSGLDQYLSEAWPLVVHMTSGFHEVVMDAAILPHFQAHITGEERRIEEALSSVSYDLDALDTLSLVVGPKGLEQVRDDAPSHLTRIDCRVHDVAPLSTALYLAASTLQDRKSCGAPPASP